jgi:hypothetical protein
MASEIPRINPSVSLFPPRTFMMNSGESAVITTDALLENKLTAPRIQTVFGIEDDSAV